MLGQTSRKFGRLPSERLGLLDRGLAVDFDNAVALRLILTGVDEDDEEWEDVPVERSRGDSQSRAKKNARDRTVYY